MKSFESCDAFEDVMETYMKSYWENNYKNQKYRTFNEPMMMEMTVDQEASFDSSKSQTTSSKAQADGVG
jgi:hypothetical protein